MENKAKVFASFEDADEADARSDAAMSPEERLRILIKLRDVGTPMRLNKDWRAFIELLNSNEVQ
jgi:hypothetical protein